MASKDSSKKTSGNTMKTTTPKTTKNAAKDLLIQKTKFSIISILIMTAISFLSGLGVFIALILNTSHFLLHAIIVLILALAVGAAGVVLFRAVFKETNPEKARKMLTVLLYAMIPVLGYSGYRYFFGNFSTIFAVFYGAAFLVAIMMIVASLSLKKRNIQPVFVMTFVFWGLFAIVYTISLTLAGYGEQLEIIIYGIPLLFVFGLVILGIITRISRNPILKGAGIGALIAGVDGAIIGALVAANKESKKK